MFYAPGLNGLPRASSSRIVCQSVCSSIVPLKPQSDIHCNPSATSPRPKFITEAEESQLGFAVCERLIGDWLPSGRLPRGDLFAT